MYTQYYFLHPYFFCLAGESVDLKIQTGWSNNYSFMGSSMNLLWSNIIHSCSDWYTYCRSRNDRLGSTAVVSEVIQSGFACSHHVTSPLAVLQSSLSSFIIVYSKALVMDCKCVFWQGKLLLNVITLLWVNKCAFVDFVKFSLVIETCCNVLTWSGN